CHKRINLANFKDADVKINISVAMMLKQEIFKKRKKDDRKE
ncbi:lipoprotein signal peptidase, partial [Campylobacter jejuni]|nr:lipoprotein signal peptidase [Campylobacter jejuni]